MRNTLYKNAWKEGAKEKELEIKTELNNKIENGMSIEESLKEVGLLK